MSFRERVRKLLKGRLPSQAQASTRSEDPGPSPASSHPEPPTIKVMASSEESATPITDDVGPPSRIREEETRHAYVSTPASSQITHFSQPGPLLRSSHLESPLIVATAPSGQPAIPLIEGPEPYLGSTRQLSGAASISSLVDAWREETLYGPLEVPTWIASQVGSRSSSGQGHPPQTLNGGVLSGAHNFSVGQMNAVETQSIGIQSVGTQNVAAQYQLYMGTNSLEKMLPHIIPGAEFNSAARDPPPRCHPDTRTQIRADLENRINGTARLIWMHGPAGVGKSAIMQTVAETVSTCATLFFSRSSDPPRNDSKKVLTTLAYGLAITNRDYRKYIEERMSQDPSFLEKSLTEQFHRLFITPFIDNIVKTSRQRWVVLLDGLDECKNEGSDQCRIVDLISNSILRYAGATPFVWVIASRPEAHLMAALRNLKESFRDRHAEFWERGIPVDSDDASRDIERYLQAEFTKIGKDNPDAFPSPTFIWPSDVDFLKVAKASSGLFVFASTLTKYISVDRPASRLKLIIALIDRSTPDSTRISQKPFSLLDMLYTQIMSDIPEDLLLIVKTLLGYYRLVSEGSIHSTGFVEVCNVLGLYQDEAYDALRKLHSVLFCPSPGTAEFSGVKYFHTSFSDFLFDRSRSQAYHVDLDQERTNIWRCYIRILKESCRTDLLALAPYRDSVIIHWAHKADPDLDKTREQLLWVAQDNCIYLLIKYGHSWCTSCPTPRGGGGLLIDAPELIDAFRSIHPVLFYADVYLSEGFVDWVNNHAPKAVQDIMIAQVFPVSQLDTERLFKSLYVRPWCWYSVYVAMRYIDVSVDVQDDTASRWLHAKGEIRGLTGVCSFDLEEVAKAIDAKMLRQCRVRVVGMEPWSPYAVIGPFPPRFGFGGNAFYVVPYSEE